MCGLFGFISYGDAVKEVNDLVLSLAISSAERGTDATGVSYLNKGKIVIEKAAKSAYQFKVSVPKNAKAVMGHTRHSTQGSEKHSINNHPFKGKLQNNSMFALAHNGVLCNDVSLRKKLKLSKTQIETDSYIAVQLLEQKGSLSMNNIKYMAEQVSGSFSFSMLDEGNNLYLVKGDSPLSILHFKDIKTYVYASTDRILWQALINSPLFDKLKNGVEEIPIKTGQILKIASNGILEYETFKFDEYVGYSWWNFNKKSTVENVYLEELKQVASSMGYDPEQVQEFYELGYAYEEIEEMLYRPEMYEFCEV